MPGQAFPGAPIPFAGSPVGGAAISSLPPRPGFNAPPMPFPGANGHGSTAAAVEDLIASVTGQSLLEAPEKEKKGKKEKDKNSRLVYSDNEISPEEKMARLPRYAFTPA